jgi:CRISPR-associated protein Cas2
MSRKPVVIAYDIVSNKRRRRVARCLKTWRLDGQFSLFECRLTETEAQELFLQIIDLIDTETDHLLLAWMDNTRDSHPITKCARIGFRIPSLYID